MTHTPNHVPCSAECAAFRAAQKSSPVPLPGHLAGCPALHPVPKRAHGQCSDECMAWRTTHRLAVNNHLPDCPALYHGPREPDALARLDWLVQNNMRYPGRETALSLISEAQEEQRRALIWARNEALQEASDEVAAMPEIAARILALKVDEP